MTHLKRLIKEEVNTVLPPLTNLIQAKKVFVSGNVLKSDSGGPLRTYFHRRSEKGPLLMVKG